ncbi:MAG: TiaS agmantine-binding domain-containing protein [Candidatus Thorarchaeota archaeon]
MGSSELIHLGMDDIDSPSMGCTTHFASLLVESLDGLGADWKDYPNLVRLNPNIPYRTRGNGAVALRFVVDSVQEEAILSSVSRKIGEYVEKSYPNTNPGVVMVVGEIPDEITEFAERALWRALPIGLAQRILRKHNLSHYCLGNGRGLIGALAAIGNRLQEDHTYEFLSYRGSLATSEPRNVDPQSVIEMDKQFQGRLFSNVDPESGRILIEPRGPDPVLFGLRGDLPGDVVMAAEQIRSSQTVDRWLVFRTNQGTNAHLKNTLQVSELRPYSAVTAEGTVASQPTMFEGGFVVFRMSDETGTIDCAAYEPSGSFRKTIMLLKQGDRIVVQAGVRPPSKSHGMTLNLEGVQVSEIAQQMKYTNPTCTKCERRMKSAGRMKGFKCVGCGHKDSTAKKIAIPVTRRLKTGYYLPPLSAQRHLTRPLTRMKRKNKGVPDRIIEKWHLP